jgi:hypothetical protein
MSTPDFIDMIDALRAHDVRFLIVGGYAVGVHGHPRATKDLDVWVEASADNARRLVRALQDFGAPLHGLAASDFEREGTGLQIGVPPGRIDVITQVSGLSFSEAWPHRLEAAFFERPACPIIGRDDLIRNKRASARLQDLADVEALEAIAAAK